MIIGIVEVMPKGRITLVESVSKIFSGKVEVMPKGHVTLVESVAKIYCSDQGNSVKIFINSEIVDEVLNMFDSVPNVEIVPRKLGEELTEYFERIKDYHTDKIYITTMDKHFEKFYEFFTYSSINLFIHDIDHWFGTSFLRNLRSFFYGFTFSIKLIYDFKVNFIYAAKKRKIIKKLKSCGGKFVVLNNNLKKELSAFVDESIIEVIPFSFYDKRLINRSYLNKTLRICIPGIISNKRRDYLGVLDFLDKNYELLKSKIELDLLGYPSFSEDGDRIIQKAEELIKKGMKIHLHGYDYIPADVFNENLSRADIILGNLKIHVEKFSFYGKTKETGVTFTLIRAAKPGIISIGYDIMEELKSSVLFYENFDQLKEILLKLADNRDYLDKLKKEAQSNSLYFEPSLIYNRLRSN